MAEVREHSSFSAGWAFRVRSFPGYLMPFTFNITLALPGELPKVYDSAFLPGKMPGKKFAVTVGEDQLIQIWHLDQKLLNTGKKTIELRGHTKAIRSVAIDRQNKYIASAGEDQTIRVWNPCKEPTSRELRDRHFQELCDPFNTATTIGTSASANGVNNSPRNPKVKEEK